MIRKLSALAGITLLGVTACTLHAAPLEIYLVRHAEKLKSADKDPELSPCGLAQAKAMAKLIPTALNTIYHSGYQRTQQTAQQVALAQSDAKLQPYNAGDLPALAAKILQQDSTVLVVGHSNTTPELIHLLSQLPAPQITEQDYGVVYQLKQSGQAYSLLSSTIVQPAICASSNS
ncbi:phosphoglycerate mutase family protein [Rheinheimera faecalis]